MKRILETERLVIREFAYDDIPLIIQYSKEKARIRELPDEVFDSTEKATKQIEMCIKNYQDQKYPLPYAIDVKHPNTIIGHILLCPIIKGVEIGYFISERYQSNGYAAEAVVPFVKWAKMNFHLECIYGQVKKSNIASCRVLEKAGFVFSHEKEHGFFGTIHMFREYTC